MGRITVNGLVVTDDLKIKKDHRGDGLFQVVGITREDGPNKRPVPKELTLFSIGSGRTVTLSAGTFRPY